MTLNSITLSDDLKNLIFNYEDNSGESKNINLKIYYTYIDNLNSDCDYFCFSCIDNSVDLTSDSLQTISGIPIKFKLDKSKILYLAIYSKYFLKNYSNLKNDTSILNVNLNKISKLIYGKYFNSDIIINNSDDFEKVIDSTFINQMFNIILNEYIYFMFVYADEYLVNPLNADDVLNALQAL